MDWECMVNGKTNDEPLDETLTFGTMELWVGDWGISDLYETLTDGSMESRVGDC